MGDQPVRLFDAKGNGLDLGTASHPEGDPKQLRVDVEERLAAGSYVVAWRVTSADSHPINGAFTFSVGAPTSGADTQSLVSGLLQDRGSLAVSWTLAVLRWIVYAAVSVAIGGWIVDRWVWPEGASLRRTRRWILTAAALAVAGSLASIAAQGAYGSGSAFGSMFDPALWGDVLRTRFGQAALIRVAGSGLLMIGVSLALSRRLRDMVCGAAAVVSVVGVAIANHSTTGRWGPIGIGADVLHVTAMCAWLGGLVGLVAWILVPRRSRAVADDTRSGDVVSVSIDAADSTDAADSAEAADSTGAAWSDAVALRATERFSLLALLSVAVLVVSGVVQGIRQVGGPTALTTTDYGKVLIVKVGIVVVLVAVAFGSRRLVGLWRRADAEAADGADTPAVRPVTPEGDVEGDADRDADDVTVGPDAVRSYLRRFVGVEVVLAGLVLVASTVLSNSVPAIEAVALPFSSTIVNSQGVGEFYIDPAKVGSTELHVVMTNVDGTLPQIDELTVTIRLAARDVGPIDVPMERYNDLPNDYWAPSATIPFAGTWTVEARGRVGEFEQKVFSTDVLVR
jgi:copper transport protein